jgi:hypothetical protein
MIISEAYDAGETEVAPRMRLFQKEVMIVIKEYGDVRLL